MIAISLTLAVVSTTRVLASGGVLVMPSDPVNKFRESTRGIGNSVGEAVRDAARYLKREAATRHRWRNDRPDHQGDSAAASDPTAGSRASRADMPLTAREIVYDVLFIAWALLATCLALYAVVAALLQATLLADLTAMSEADGRTESFFSIVRFGWTLVLAHLCTGLWPFAIRSSSWLFKIVVFAGLADILAYYAQWTMVPALRGERMFPPDIGVMVLNTILAAISLILFLRDVVRAIKAGELTHAG